MRQALQQAEVEQLQLWRHPIDLGYLRAELLGCRDSRSANLGCDAWQLASTTDTVTDSGAVTAMEVADAGEWRLAMDRGHHSNYENHKRTGNAV